MKVLIQRRLVRFRVCLFAFVVVVVVFNFFSFYNCLNRRIRPGVFASLLRPNSKPSDDSFGKSEYYGIVQYLPHAAACIGDN